VAVVTRLALAAQKSAKSAASYPACRIEVDPSACVAIIENGELRTE